MDDQFENKAEELKGRAKESAGAAVDNDQLKADGQNDQHKAALKNKINQVRDKIENKIDDVL